MSRPITLADARKLNMWVDNDTIEQLDAMRRAHKDIPSRAEMIRRLIAREWSRLCPPEPRQPRRRSTSVCEFLRRRGGLRDQGGALTAMDLHKLRPGLVNNKRGLTLDHAREILVEAGYLHEAGPNRPAITTPDHVVELIRDELAGISHEAHDCPF